ncbi:MAG: hypothetical protein MR787_04130 [Bacteroidales bacterium]|nr:hypothetical protein [Bacteroidales bacterium]
MTFKLVGDSYQSFILRPLSFIPFAAVAELTFRPLPPPLLPGEAGELKQPSTLKLIDDTNRRN